MTDGWRSEAECRGIDPRLFFDVERGDRYSPEARAACARCLVRDDCLTEALTDNQRHGLWGGLSPRQRRLLRQGETLTRVLRCDGCGHPFVWAVKKHTPPNACSVECRRLSRQKRQKRARVLA